MGTYNLKEFVEKIQNFKDNKCPICDTEIVVDNSYQTQVDCIHYECNVCSPQGCMISMSGSLLASDHFIKLLNDSNTKNFIQMKIRACTSGEVKIMMNDFR